MKQGDIVTIYEDPIARKKPEGRAILLECLKAAANPHDLQDWHVKFVSDGFCCRRSLLEVETIKCPECNEEGDASHPPRSNGTGVFQPGHGQVARAPASA